MFGSSKPNPFAERKEPTVGPPGVMAEERNPEDEKWWKALGDGGGTFAGPTVTRDSAMRLSAVFACVRLIAGSIAGRPSAQRWSHFGPSFTIRASASRGPQVPAG